MSDQSTPAQGTQADQSAETAQGTVEQGSTPPWGEDFQPERAWETIQNQRTTEKELKDRLRQAEAVWEDEQLLQEKLSALGFEFADDEDDTEDITADDVGEEDAAPDPRVEAHDAWIRQQQERQALREFNDDLNVAAGEAKVKLSDRERRAILTESVQNGFTPDSTRDALTALVEDREQLRQSWQQDLKESKRAPHVPSSGQAATQVPDLDDDQQRQAWMGERFRAMNDD